MCCWKAVAVEWMPRSHKDWAVMQESPAVFILNTYTAGLSSGEAVGSGVRVSQSSAQLSVKFVWIMSAAYLTYFFSPMTIAGANTENSLQNQRRKYGMKHCFFASVCI